MRYYLLVCRSLTYAQRVLRLLERSGLTAVMVRTPKLSVNESCGYSVKVREDKLSAAVAVLRAAQFMPKRLLRLSDDGDVTEVAF